MAAADQLHHASHLRGSGRALHATNTLATLTCIGSIRKPKLTASNSQSENHPTDISCFGIFIRT